MKSILSLPLAILLILSLQSTSYRHYQEKESQVALVTNYGTIVLKLYNETPKHRDNFLSLVTAKAYDSLLFHRVIENFMIQGGDPDSKTATSDENLGDGSVDYTVPAEFHPELFHKKGALATARDQNKTRASSGIQIFIVQGKIHTDSLLEVAENRINKMLARHYAWNDPEIEPLFDSIEKLSLEEDKLQMKMYQDSLESLLETFDNFKRYSIPDTHRQVYKTIGGTPHLDQNYTVFGEVVSGLEVLDSIAAVKTNSMNRPIRDVRILAAKILE